MSSFKKEKRKVGSLARRPGNVRSIDVKSKSIRLGTPATGGDSTITSLVTIQLCHPKPAIRKDALYRIKALLSVSDKHQQVFEFWSFLLPGIFSRICDQENWIRSFCIDLVAAKMLFQSNDNLWRPYIAKIVSLLLSCLNNLDDEIQIDSLILLGHCLSTINPVLFKKHIPTIIKAILAWIESVSTPGRFQRMSSFTKIFGPRKGIPFWTKFFESLLARSTAERRDDPVVIYHQLATDRRIIPPRRALLSPIDANWDLDDIPGDMDIKPLDLRPLDELAKMSNPSASDMLSALKSILVQ